jgi:hypothetical protein
VVYIVLITLLYEGKKGLSMVSNMPETLLVNGIRKTNYPRRLMLTLFFAAVSQTSQICERTPMAMPSPGPPAMSSEDGKAIRWLH